MEDPVKHVCTMAEAKALIRKNRKGRRCMISVETQLPIEGKPGRAFPGMAYVPVSRKVAEQFIDRVVGETLEGRGARIRMEVHHNIIFIG